MKLDHGVILDLLPLYAEGLTSQASAALVEAHLRDCPACAAELAALKAKPPAVPGQETQLMRLSRAIKTRRWLSVLLAASLVLALATAFFAFATEKLFVPYSKDNLRVTREGDRLLIAYRGGNLLPSLTGFPAPGHPGVMHYELKMYTQRLWGPDNEGEGFVPFQYMPDPDKGIAGDNNPVPRQIEIDLSGRQEAALYYVDPDGPAVLLYGRDLYPGGGYMTLPRLALVYYLYIALLALALGLALFIFYNKPRARTALKILLGLPLSYLGGQLLVKGFSTLSYDSLARDLGWILACAAALYVAWLAFWALRRQMLQGRLT